MPPSIACLPNGPYALADAPLEGAGGELYPTGGGRSLCRCGGSNNKPFCDGTHRHNGFSDARTADASANRRETYVGKSITLFDNRAVCAHAGVCTDNLKEVFREEGTPWIDADGAAAAKIIAIVERCPSGALGYAVGGREAAAARGEPRVSVTRDGPYRVSAVELAGVEFGDGASPAHYTLCRCGASANKPFCDGSHWTVGFRDP